MPDENTHSLPFMESRRSDLQPEISARLNQPFWNAAQWQELECQWNGDPIQPGLKTTFASRWTSGFLYFAFITHFEKLTRSSHPRVEDRTPELWNKEDVVEIFLAPDIRALNHYQEFEVSPSSQWIDIDLDRESGTTNFEWASGMEARSVIDLPRKVWEAEFRIPLKAFHPATFGPGWVVGLNAFRVELRSDQYLTWSPTWTPSPNFHVPACFGRMEFVS